ncbi:carboxylesterase family protein [Sphaerisporangium sp. B11E5]|uniref:carboxylesterase family protein n=1 Tax=Sphaerisporangium sp. B11E5 TaxID=3153563 RepID=UPI00325DF7E3
MPTAPAPEAETPYGRVRGDRDDAIAVFRAIPHTATPRGAARFAAPVPPAPWRQVRDPVILPAKAPAPPRDRIGPLDMTAFSGAPWRPADTGDHLTATVWTPAADSRSRLPVLVFVHGGGFLAGTGDAAAYDGAALARRGIVVVTLNYRLGAPGWLHLDDAPDNRGLLDVIAALRWVRSAIGAFGGDPGRVTLMGQSAGATVVGALLATPAAAGLFRRAIVQSGNGLGALTPGQARRVTAALADAAAVPPTVAGLAAVSDADLVTYTAALAGLDLDVDGARDPLLGLGPYGVVSAVQPAAAVAAGHGRDVDLLLGINADEANLYLVPTARHDRDARQMSQDLFGRGTEALAVAHAGAGGRTFRYRFDWRSDAFDGALGAAHCMELPFVFGTTGIPSLRGPQALLGTAPVARELTDAIQAAWVRFVTSGDPGWPRFTADDPHIEKLGTARAATTPAGWTDHGFPLSAAVRTGNLVHVSGQIAVDPVTFTPVGRTVTEQVEQVFRNIAAALDAAGATLDDIVSTRVYLRDPAAFAEMNAAYARLAPRPYPARTTVYMQLPDDYQVEIEAIAVRTGQP